MKFSCCFLQIPSQYNVLSTNNDLLSKNIICLIYLLKPKPKPCMSKKSSAYLSKASQLWAKQSSVSDNVLEKKSRVCK
jgi:hypothetical protein